MECWIQFYLHSVKQNEFEVHLYKEQKDKECACFLLGVDSYLGGLQIQHKCKSVKHKLISPFFLASSKGEQIGI